MSFGSITTADLLGDARLLINHALSKELRFHVDFHRFETQSLDVGIESNWMGFELKAVGRLHLLAPS